MKVYIYCSSYQAFLAGLFLELGNKNLEYLTPNKDIIECCKTLGISYRKIKDYRLSEFLKNSEMVKREIDKQIKKLIEGELFFSHTQFDIGCFVFISRLPKNIKPRFLNFEQEYRVISKFEFNFSYFKYWLISKILNRIYKTQIVIKKNGKLYVLGIEQVYLKKNNIEIIDNKGSYTNEIITVIKNTHIPLPQVDNLLIHQELSRFISFNELTRFYKILNRKKISVKMHPNLQNHKEESYFPSLEKINSPLPVELVFRQVKNKICSVNSVSLILASKIYPGRAISLLELVEWKDDRYKLEQKNFLTQKSEGAILFPQSLHELDQLLNL